MTQAESLVGGRPPRQSAPRSWTQRPDVLAWDPRTTSVPWTSKLLFRWGIVVGAGALALAVAWYLAAGDASYTKQAGPIDLAVFGLVIAGAANIWVLLVARRTIGIRRRILVGEAAPLAAAVSRRPHAGSSTSAPSTDVLVGQPGLKHYHRSDCPLARSKGWPTATRAEHEGLGLQPCQVCRP